MASGAIWIVVPFMPSQRVFAPSAAPDLVHPSKDGSWKDQKPCSPLDRNLPKNITLLVPEKEEKLWSTKRFQKPTGDFCRKIMMGQALEDTHTWEGGDVHLLNLELLKSQ